MKYLVVGYNTKFVEPGFRSEHDTLEAAISEASAMLSNNSHQVTVEVFASQKVLVGMKRAWDQNGILATPERFDEVKKEARMDEPRLPTANAVASLRNRAKQLRGAFLKSPTE